MGMLTLKHENFLAKILGFGSTFVAVLVITGTVTDPVNLTKLFALGGVAGAAFAICTINIRMLVAKFKLVSISIVVFLIASFNSIFQSDSPLTQNLYGAYGRNTGFIAYLLFIFMFFSALALSRRSSFDTLIWGIIVAGVVNNIYCLWVLIFGDFVGWNNPYGNILGTFGNPNFIGAFLGMYAACLVAYSLAPGANLKYRLLAFLLFGVTSFEIVKSNAIQGRVLLVGGLAIVGFYLLRAKFKSAYPLILYTFFIVFSGTISLLGALQIGPLAKYIYKYSVSLRGEYWQAGWNMAVSHPLTGVGFDSYGDWYRRSRDINALVVPGVNTVTNAAHNVAIDVLAYGGWPLFTAYLTLILLTTIAIIRFTIRNRDYDKTFVALTVGWVCYQIQSFISINQIGLAIWGWMLGGALIAYERANRNTVTSTENSGKVRGRSHQSQVANYLSPQILAGIGAVIGLIFACPPYSADSKFYSALRSQDVAKIEESLIPTYLTPSSSYKYAYAADIMESSQLHDLAFKYAKKATEFNPNHFDSWRIYLLAKNTPEAERAKARENLHRLDPYNPEFKESK